MHGGDVLSCFTNQSGCEFYAAFIPKQEEKTENLLIKMFLLTELHNISVYFNQLYFLNKSIEYEFQEIWADFPHVFHSINQNKGTEFLPPCSIHGINCNHDRKFLPLEVQSFCHSAVCMAYTGSLGRNRFLPLEVQGFCHFALCMVMHGTN